MQSTILLVDDEVANLELLQELLKDDYALVCARNGPKALMLAQQQPDLILLDIMMPGMDGYEVCRRLKANEKTQAIPIIFIASKREMADEIDGLKIGAADYIAKPLTPMEVKARVKAYLALRAANQTEDDRSGCSACHDLKAPIGRLMELAGNLLKESTLSAEQKKSLNAIQNEGFHALCMIHLSLGMPSMEEGRYALKPSSVDLLALVRTIRAQLEWIIRDKRLTLKIQLHSKTETEKNVFVIQGETMLCYSLLFNLIKRALEAAPNDQTVLLSMEDTGKGGIVRIIDPGFIPGGGGREQFFAKESTISQPSGIGLDGYTAKLLAEIQGGRIRMRTDNSRGTEIVFSLPKGEADV